MLISALNNKKKERKTDLRLPKDTSATFKGENVQILEVDLLPLLPNAAKSATLLLYRYTPACSDQLLAAAQGPGSTFRPGFRT